MPVVPMVQPSVGAVLVPVGQAAAKLMLGIRKVLTNANTIFFNVLLSF